MLQGNQESTIIGKVKRIMLVFMQLISGLKNNQIVNFGKLNKERGSAGAKKIANEKKVFISSFYNYNR